MGLVCSCLSQKAGNGERSKGGEEGTKSSGGGVNSQEAEDQQQRPIRDAI